MTGHVKCAPFLSEATDSVRLALSIRNTTPIAPLVANVLQAFSPTRQDNVLENVELMKFIAPRTINALAFRDWEGSALFALFAQQAPSPLLMAPAAATAASIRHSLMADASADKVMLSTRLKSVLFVKIFLTASSSTVSVRCVPGV